MWWWLYLAVVPVEAGGGDGDFLVAAGVEYGDAQPQQPCHAEGLEDIDGGGGAVALQVDQGDTRLSVVAPGNELSARPDIDKQQAVIREVGILAAIVSDGQLVSGPVPGVSGGLEPEVAVALLDR